MKILISFILLLSTVSYADEDYVVSEVEVQETELIEDIKTHNYWSMGFGPFFGSNMNSNSPMLHFDLSRIWTVDPVMDFKLLAETNFATDTDKSQLHNGAIGANYFVWQGDTSGFLTGDFGYGAARSNLKEWASGFSLGAGFGVQMFRRSEKSLNVLFRSVWILDEFKYTKKSPNVTGIHLALVL